MLGDMKLEEKFSENSGLLHRIDERTNLLMGKFQEIREELHEHREKMNSSYVSQGEFAPVRNIVYGIVSTILLSVLGSIIALVVAK